MIRDDRVMGVLGLSRGFGDFSYKDKEGLDQRQQMVTALPEVREIPIDDKTQFVFLACDGIWDKKNNQEVEDHFMGSLF